MPQARTLYEPSTEHDSCGFGFVADVSGKASHAIVRDALTVLVNLEHRGASGSEANTGDGAGLLVAMPHRFLGEVAAEAGVRLPATGYGVAMVFLPRDEPSRDGARERFEQSLAAEGLQLLGWRDVPTDPDRPRPAPPPPASPRSPRPSSPGRTASRRERTATSTSTAGCTSRADWLEKAVGRSALPGRGDFYVPSMSCRTIVYKGMLNARQLLTFYPDVHRRAARERHRPRPLAVLDQHLPVVGPGAPVPLHQPQRRDQHAARERELDVRPPVHVHVVGVRRRPGEGAAGRRRRRIRHRDLRQRARAAPPVGPEPRPRHDDDGPRAVEPRHPDVARPARLLRVPRVPDGAVGRTGLARVHRRRAGRRDARPQRAPPGPLLGDPRRPGRDGVRVGRPRHPRPRRRRQGPPPARPDVPRGHEPGPDRRRRRAEGGARLGPALRAVGPRLAWSPSRTCPGPRRSSEPDHATVLRRQHVVRLHHRGRAADHRRDGGHRRRPHRLDGQRRAARGPQRAPAAPVQLLQAALRAGHQPAGRRDPRGAHHGDGPLDRSRGQPARARPRRRPPGRAPLPDPVATRSWRRSGRSTAGPASRGFRTITLPILFKVGGQRLGPPARDRGPPPPGVRGHRRGLQPDHPVRPRPQRVGRADPGAARRVGRPSPPGPQRDAGPGRPGAGVRGAAARPTTSAC